MKRENAGGLFTAIITDFGAAVSLAMNSQGGTNYNIVKGLSMPKTTVFTPTYASPEVKTIVKNNIDV
jgi:serine/threonine protein kinase